MSQQLEEPDVTPLINVNLVILVMTLLMASHAARLLQNQGRDSSHGLLR